MYSFGAIRQASSTEGIGDLFHRSLPFMRSGTLMYRRVRQLASDRHDAEHQIRQRFVRQMLVAIAKA